MPTGSARAAAKGATHTQEESIHAANPGPFGGRPPSAPASGTLAALAARIGRVRNIHGEMAHAPAVLATYAAMHTAIG